MLAWVCRSWKRHGELWPVVKHNQIQGEEKRVGEREEKWRELQLGGERERERERF